MTENDSGDRSQSDELDREQCQPSSIDADYMAAKEQAEKASMPLWDAALAHDYASFEHVVEVIGGCRSHGNPVQKFVCERYFPLLIGAFEASHGQIVRSFFCDNLVGGIVLTNQGRLVCNCAPCPSDCAPLVDLLHKCDDLSTEVHYVFDDSKDASAVLNMLFSVMHQILNELDSAALASNMKNSGGEVIAVSNDEKQVTVRVLNIDVLTEDYTRALRYFERAAQRAAQLTYLRGMMLGIGAVFLLSIGLSGAFSLWDVQGLQKQPFVASIVAGSLGATVSVMSRMSFGKLSLDHTAGTQQLIILGAVRPFLGCIFGVILHMLLAGGLLSLRAPNGSEVYFYAGLAFLAGFSERFAQDMLVVAERGVRGDRAHSEPLRADQSVEPPPSTGARRPGR